MKGKDAPSICCYHGYYYIVFIHCNKKSDNGFHGSVMIYDVVFRLPNKSAVKRYFSVICFQDSFWELLSSDEKAIFSTDMHSCVQKRTHTSLHYHFLMRRMPLPHESTSSIIFYQCKLYSSISAINWMEDKKYSFFSLYYSIGCQMTAWECYVTVISYICLSSALPATSAFRHWGW